VPDGSRSGYSPSPSTTSGPGFGYLSSAFVFGVEQPLLTFANNMAGREVKAIVAARCTKRWDFSPTLRLYLEATSRRGWVRWLLRHLRRDELHLRPEAAAEALGAAGVSGFADGMDTADAAATLAATGDGTEAAEAFAAVPLDLAAIGLEAGADETPRTLFGDAALPDPPVMVTTAQFMKNSCSRLIHVQAKTTSPFGKSEGTVNGNFCPEGSSPLWRCGQLPS